MSPEADDLRVVVVGDDHLARAGLAALLEEQPDCTVAGQVAPGDIAEVGLDLFQADIAIWDLGWGTSDGLDRMADIEATALPTIVLVQEDSDAQAAWAAGARGVLHRDVDGSTVVSALRATQSGLAVTDLDMVGGFAGPSEDLEPEGASDLTPREMDVLHLLAEGQPNKTVASQLDISEHTVKFHVNAILSKLGAQSRTDAVIRATRVGLIRL